MEHCCSQHGQKTSHCDITAESRIGDIRRRLDRQFRYVIFVSGLIVRHVACVVIEGGAVACVGLKEAQFEPPLLIADVAVQ